MASSVSGAPKTLLTARSAALVGLGAALGCATSSAPPPLPTTEAAAPAPAARGDGKAPPLLRPDQVFAILEKSEITYDLVSSEELEAIDLAEVVALPLPPPRPVDPYLEIKRDPGGRLRMLSSRPPEAAAEIFEKAGDAFAAREYEVARALYAKAVEVAPEYFKSYTYLGNALFFLGDYTRAEQLFLRALSLNPLDYQALLFLGDTYYQLGDYGRSKAALTRAYMMNRTNPAVEQRLSATLAKLRLRVREERLMPAVRIEQTGPKEVALRFDRSQGLRWISLATCMACWSFEPECRQRAPEEQDPLRLGMYRECLIHQAAAIAVRKQQEMELPRDEEVLLDAIEGGFLEAIVFWEVIARVAPAVILLLPDEVQEEILRYIEKYVFVSTMVV